jgi:hypothetical protein
MSGKNSIDVKGIEARLDRSLRKQVQVPRLDRSFDAAVWARIEEAEAKSPDAVAEPAPARAVRPSRWLAISNSIGIAATLGVALYFALGSFGGMEPQALHIDLNVPMPTLSNDMVTRIVGVLGQALGVAALLFGLSFTSLGRRLRASFS